MAARRLHHLIYVTIANCGLFLIVCGISLGTNWWFTSHSNGENMGEVTARFGLFNGVKTKESISGVRKRYNLKIVCKGTKGCMFSCGTTAEMRNEDIDSLLDGKEDQDFCRCNEVEELCKKSAIEPNVYSNRNVASKKTTSSNSTVINAEEGEQSEYKGLFMNFGLYVSTVGFIALGMIFAIISGMLALYNTYRTPIQPMLSVSGLYFWNGTSAGFVLLAMIMWLIEFTTGLRKNAAISDTISGTFDSSGKGSLGVSFWILILPILFALANIVILKYRTWKIVKMEEKNVRVMKNEDENGEIILF